MDIIKANEVESAELRTFVDTSQSIDQRKLLQSGYVIRQSDALEGCFVLEETVGKAYWLKQMYLTKNAVTSLPVLFEAVVALAKRKQAERLIIYSHQHAIDTILEALQFYPQNDRSSVDNPVNNQGRWWEYSISS